MSVLFLETLKQKKLLEFFIWCNSQKKIKETSPEPFIHEIWSFSVPEISADQNFVPLKNGSTLEACLFSMFNSVFCFFVLSCFSALLTFQWDGAVFDVAAPICCIQLAIREIRNRRWEGLWPISSNDRVVELQNTMERLDLAKSIIRT